MHIFRDQARYLRCWIPNDIEQSDDIRSTCKILENLDLSFNFLLLHWFQHLDDAFFVRNDIDTFEDLGCYGSVKSMRGENRNRQQRLYTHLGVFSPTDFSNNLVVVLSSPLNLEVVLREMERGLTKQIGRKNVRSA